MAESILSDVAARIISNLGSLVLKEIGLWWGLKDELHKLEETVSTIQAVLLDAEERSLLDGEENHQVKVWLGKLSEAMCDADDLVDEFPTEAELRQAGSKMSKKVRRIFSSYKMAHKVKSCRERLDEIAALRKFHLDEGRVERSILSRETHSSPPEVVIGREHDKEKIVERLLLSSDGDKGDVLVVSILGIGGLGKTTLAQMVYDDDTVKNHFELKMWVCVSLDFDVQKLVEKVLESATGKKPENTQFDALKNLLHEKINGRRYVLVLDDVWNEDVGKWLSLKDLLAGGAKGSKILITTRLRKFVEMSRPIYIHELSGLPQEQAWSLFKQMAFKEGEVQHPSHEVMGREIVAKCRGVPLAIRVIGGMLYSKDLESEWLLFKGKELLKMDENGSIFPILKLSYNHLPSHYKHCFAYCSLYPEDFRIPVEELIRLWKAQGYLKSTDAGECLQDVGYGWFMDLYRLSFFQDVEKDEFGKIKSCKMHDLMHYLAISVAGHNFSSSLTDMKDNTRHMSLWVDEISTLQDLSPLLKAKRIRTVLPLVEYGSSQDIIKEKELDDVFCNLRCLRVLSFSCLNICKLPSSIYKLKHLRHLDLSRNKNIKKLPDSITNLLNLQVLKLSECRILMQLPNNITKLVNLKDLCNEGCNGLTHMPRGIGKLTRLEQLSLFVIAKDNSILSKHSGGLNELQGLNNLRGELEINNLKYVKKADGFEFKEAILSEKKQLQGLTLRWSEDDDGNDNCSADDVGNDEMELEALRPHQNLKKLEVFRYRGVRPPSWLPSLTNLVSFHIWFCRSIKWLPPLDQLPHLKMLRVEFLTELEHIDVKNRGSSSSIFFPSLEELILISCPNLKCLPPLDQLSHLKKLRVEFLTELERIDVENRGSSSLFFPSLEVLTLVDCPNMKGFERCNKTSDVVGSSLSMEELPSCFPRLSYLRITRCPSLKLTCMPLFPELKKLELDGDGVKSLMGVLKMRTTSSTSESTSSSPFSTLSQLEHLEILEMEDCAEVDELEQYLPSLQTLEFFKCTCKSVSSDEKDDAMQWQSLKALRSVEFLYMENLVCLPKGLQYVTTLQHLCIYNCPKLSERCKNNTAEDWPKISHIPNIYIEFRSIQRNGYYLL